MMAHVTLSLDFHAPFVDLSPGLVGLGDCGSLLTHSKTERMIGETNVARNFLPVKQASDSRDFNSVYWLPATR